jgi:hemerythrin-like domain-containing protein
MPTPQDAIALLKADHKKVKALMEELEETTERAVAKRKTLRAKIATEIRVHARIEEEVFYPAFHASGQTREDSMLFHEAAQEHEVVTNVLDELERMDPATEKFAAQAKVLKDIVLHHVEEEEGELFPRSRKLLDKDELRELGVRMAERKQVLMEQMSESAA